MTTKSFPRRYTRDHLRRFIATNFGGNRDAYWEHLNTAMNAAMREDLRRAKRLANGIGRLLELVTGAERAHLMRMMARYLHLSGQAAEAHRFYAAAQRFYRRSGDALSVARIGRAMTDVLMYMGRYQDAIAAGRDSARIFRRRRMALDWAQTLTNVGNVYHRQDDNTRALAAYDKARGPIAASGSKPMLGLVDFNRANVLTNLGRLPEARVCYLAASAIYSDAGMHLARTQVDYSLAYLDYLGGDYANALRQFAHVADRFRSLDDRKALADTELDVLEISLELELHSVVEGEATQVAKRFRRLGMAYEEAKCWYFLARARAALEDLAGAHESLRVAHTLLKRQNNRVWNGILILFGAQLLVAEDRPEPAQRLAKQALAEFHSAGDHRRIIAAELCLAMLDLQQGRDRSCQRRLERVFRGRFKPSPSALLEAWWLEARRRVKQGHPREALRAYRKSFGILDSLAGLVPADETLLLYRSGRTLLVREMVDLLSSLGQHEEALALIRRFRSRSQSTGRDFETTPAAEDPASQKLRSQLRRLYHLPNSGGRLNVPVADDVRRVEEQLWRRARKVAARAAPEQGRRIETREHRDPNQTTIVYHFGTRSLSTHVLTRDTIKFAPLRSTIEDAQDAVSRFHFFMERGRMSATLKNNFRDESLAGIREQFERIAKLFVWPLLGLLGNSDSLVICTDGPLQSIPMHLLPLPDGTTLMDRYRVSLVSDLDWASGDDRASISANDSGDLFLPFPDESLEMRIEADTITRLLPRLKVHAGEFATRPGLGAALRSDSKFVHVASHARAALDNPLFSEILLHDGPFYLFDLMNLHGRKELVTLAACQTGRPGILPSGEAYGLASAFIARGAKSVLSSLWTVDDRTTRIFVSEFYRGITAGQGMNAAWRQAIAVTRSHNDDPFHWAPFVLIGLTD